MLTHFARGITKAAFSAGQTCRGALVFGQRAYHEKVNALDLKFWSIGYFYLLSIDLV